MAIPKQTNKQNKTQTSEWKLKLIKASEAEHIIELLPVRSNRHSTEGKSCISRGSIVLWWKDHIPMSSPRCSKVLWSFAVDDTKLDSVTNKF